MSHFKFRDFKKSRDWFEPFWGDIMSVLFLEMQLFAYMGQTQQIILEFNLLLSTITLMETKL